MKKYRRIESKLYDKISHLRPIGLIGLMQNRILEYENKIKVTMILQ